MHGAASHIHAPAMRDEMVDGAEHVVTNKLPNLLPEHLSPRTQRGNVGARVRLEAMLGQDKQPEERLRDVVDASSVLLILSKPSLPGKLHQLLTEAGRLLIELANQRGIGEVPLRNLIPSDTNRVERVADADDQARLVGVLPNLEAMEILGHLLMELELGQAVMPAPLGQNELTSGLHTVNNVPGPVNQSGLDFPDLLEGVCRVIPGNSGDIIITLQSII